MLTYAEVAGEQHRLLIGPRGTTIRDLESQSGARLSFELEPPSLVARGPPAARERALALAKQVLQCSSLRTHVTYIV